VTTACPPVLKNCPPKQKKTIIILPSLKTKQTMSKISSVTVFTEVVAMISSFHRNSEKKKHDNRKKNYENFPIAQKTK
jgi:hypothetical protein